jgi:hypothetical protein
MSGKRQKTDDVNYQVYVDERKSLVEAEKTTADHFDNNILTLAAGALGISLVFLEKIAPEPNPKTLIYLYLAWASLVSSLLIILSSQLTGQYAYRRARDLLEDEFFPEENKENRKKGNRWGRTTQILNWASIVAFIVGVTALALFSIQNVRCSLIDRKSKSTISATTGIPNEHQTTK